MRRNTYKGRSVIDPGPVKSAKDLNPYNDPNPLLLSTDPIFMIHI